MKIIDLLEAFTTDIKHMKSRKEFTPRHRRIANQRADASHNPKGLYGRVFNNTNDPHVVNKINHEHTYLKNDGYYRYISYVAKHELAQNNPYFPRVYSIKTVEDVGGLARFKIEIEKLSPLDSLSYPQLKVVMDKLNTELFDDTVNLRDNIDIMINFISDMPYSATQSDDDNFNQAMKLIDSIANGGVDMHSGNLMVRLTGVGPQLVIIDPII